MSEYITNLLSVAILDFKREKESVRLLESLREHLKVSADIVYCHDGPPNQYVQDAYQRGEIDTLLVTKHPRGCGIQTRQLFQACMTPYVLYVQVDQYLVTDFDSEVLEGCVNILKDPGTFYVDLAGNQGHGRPSERALLMERKRYLSIEGIDSTIGGPGPYACYPWTEAALQNHMQKNGLRFATIRPLFFTDNGKESRRAYPCGGETLHYTDEKTLFITKPLKQRYDFPNLRLTDDEWAEVLEGRWPVEGKIPEKEKSHSFKVW